MTYAIVKLKTGTKAFVDHQMVEISSEVGPNTRWLAEKRSNYISLTRPGFGTKDDYVNGSAMTRNVEGLILMTPWCLIESPLLADVRSWKF